MATLSKMHQSGPAKDPYDAADSETPYVAHRDPPVSDAAANSTFSDEDFLFDSINAQFHIRVFVEQFIAHTFVPLAPLFANLRAQRFISTSLISNLFNLLLPLMVYVMCFSYAFMSKTDRARVHGSIVVPLVLFLLHRIMVALKYSTLSETEMRRFMLCKDPVMAGKFLAQMNLLGDWHQRDQRLLDFELGSACIRVAARINEMTLSLPPGATQPSNSKNLQHWNAFLSETDLPADDSAAPLCEQLQVSGDQSVHVSVLDCCRAIIRCSDLPRPVQKFTLYFIIVYALVNGLLPFVLIADGNELDNPTLVYVYLFCTVNINTFFGVVVFLLLALAIWDAARVVNMLRSIHAMIRLTDVMVEPEVSALRTFRSGGEEEDNRSRNQTAIQALLQRRVRKAHSVGASTGQLASFYAPPPLADRPEQPSSVVGSPAESVYSQMPTIDLCFKRNVSSWTYTRLTIQNFGDRFRLRTDIYNAIVLAISSGLAVAVLVDIYGAHDVEAEFGSCFVVQSLMFLTMAVLLLLAVAVTGAVANYQLAMHNHTLALHTLRLRTAIQDLKSRKRQLVAMDMLSSVETQQCEAEAEALNEVADSIESASDSIQFNTEAKPFRLGGSPTNGSLVFVLISSYIIYMMVVVSLYFSYVQGALMGDDAR